MPTVLRICRTLAFVGMFFVCEAAFAAALKGRVTTPDGHAVAGAVVTASPVAGAVAAAKPGTRAVMIQEGKQFIPEVLPVQVGTTVDFPNRDSFRHQVYSFSAAKTFELKLYGSDEVGSVTFDKPGAVPVGCNIHDNMLAYVYVVSTPHFATTGPDGTVDLKDIPGGTYSVTAWHPNQRGTPEIQQVTLTGDDATVTVKVTLRSNRGQRKPAALDEQGY